MKKYSLRYGEGEVKFSLESSLVISEPKIKEYPKLQNPKEAILHAINNPIGCKPFREIFKAGEIVAFIVNDSTRVANSHEVLPVMFDELNSVGIKDDDIFIIFALGTHRPMTIDEMTHEVGTEVARRVKLYSGDCHDESQFKYFGTTSFGTPVAFHKLVAEADHIVATGSVLFHYLAGYGGGRKAMLPGVAYYETIRKNHSMMFSPDSRMGKLKGNPIHEDQMEAVEMCRPSFLVNTVLNEKKQTLRVFAGDYIEAHMEACKFVDEVYVTDIKEKADLVIVSSGGYPKDIDVYQLYKTMNNASCAVRDGGIVILIGECRDGAGSKTYEEVMRESKTPDKIEAATKANFHIGAHKAYCVTKLMRKAEYILVSGLDDDIVKELLFTPAKDIESALKIAYEKLGESPSIIVMPQGSYTVPRVKE